PIDALRPNPYQPRTDFPEEALAGLAESIKSAGMLQPIIAVPVGEQFYVIAGERRLRAARIAGLNKVPVIPRAAADKDMIVYALVENLHREDLNVIEEAASYERLIKEFELPHAGIAALVNKSRSHITNTLRLLTLPESVRELLAGGHIGPVHGRLLLMLSDAKVQEAVAQRIVREKLSVRQLENLVQQLSAKPASRKRSAGSSEAYKNLASEMSEKLGRRVWIQAYGKPGKEKGRIVIEFLSPDDFAEIQRVLISGRAARR
ncbi:MAG TPA: ParB/RepB/Spo0J family partition protein, partial [Planctomycetes bacterium]|nr:ParB/RepB/Spo0J family partition protein [Planctomycetota bacterium]